MIIFENDLKSLKHKWISGQKKEVAKEIINWDNDDIYRFFEYLTREDCFILSTLINEYRN